MEVSLRNTKQLNMHMDSESPVPVQAAAQVPQLPREVPGAGAGGQHNVPAAVPVDECGVVQGGQYEAPVMQPVE